MKIAMLNRKRDTWTGGDMVQLDAISQQLTAMGHDVRYGDDTDTNCIRWADVCHLHNLTMPWTFEQFAACQALDKKVVLSPIYTENERFVSKLYQQRILRMVNAIVCLCDGELKRLEANFDIDREKVSIVGNGVDDLFFADIAKQDIPFPDSYVLTVGRLEEFKGQRYVAAACQKMGIPYVCIGDGEDGALLRYLGAKTLPSMPQEELVKYYAGCSVYVLASQSEVFPLSVMEAAAQNKKIVLTDNSCWQPDGVINCTYNDQDSIRKALETDGGKIDVTSMTWQNAALQLEKVYLCL